MRKKTLLILVIIVALLGIYAAYLFQNNKKTTTEQSSVSVTVNHSANDNNTAPNNKAASDTVEQVPEIGENEENAIQEEQPQEEKAEEKFTGILDMGKWKYNSEAEVYYQTGIYYAQTSIDSQFQKMALFVPEKYLRCDKTDNDLYSCDPNMEARINNYTVRTAPIVSEINSPAFAAEAALTEYRDYKEYTDNGLVYAHIGFRGIEHAAPAAVTDIKAAIHFIKYNSERIPGNTNSIFVLGANHGAALAAVVAASGDSRLYLPYLQEIGSLSSLNDSIKGVMLVNPISGLDTANEAVEWFFSYDRQGLDDTQKQLSEKMAKEYANYVNRAGFIGPKGNALTLQYSQNGTYQNGTYYDYFKETIKNSLTDFLNHNKFPFAIPKSWEISEEQAAIQNNIKLAGTYQTREKFFQDLNAKKTWVIDRPLRGISVVSLDGFNNIFNRNQPPLAMTDGLTKNRTGNKLFALGDKKPLHFDLHTAKIFKNTPTEKEYGTDFYKRDRNGYNTLKRLDIYNPLYFLVPSYEGYRTSTVAPYWRIRSGLFQNHNILPTTINLYLAINNYLKGENIDYKMVWGMGDIKEIRNKDRTEFIEWIKNIK